jgi:hypothetical protein
MPSEWPLDKAAGKFRSTTRLLLHDSHLDGTLMDSNHEHVTGWRVALRRAGVELPNAFLHRCIGMRGDLLVKAVGL